MTGPPSGEIERLRREKQVLDEQVRQLVQVEQRLYRSRNELNTQLENMRTLDAFALSCSGLSDAASILVRAVTALAGAFTLDWIVAVRFDPEAACLAFTAVDPPSAPRSPEPLTAAETARLVALPPVRLVTLPAGADSVLCGLLDRLRPAETPTPSDRPGDLLVFSLRSEDGPEAFLFAYAAKQERTMYWPEDLSDRNLPFLNLLQNHIEQAMDNAALTSDLRERTAELTASLAELERAQHRLLEAQKMEAIGQLAGGVAHDFNNILTVILGHASVLKDRLAPNDPLHGNIRQILTAGERAAGITRQLLAFGRRQTQRRESVDLNRLASAMAEMLERLIGEHIRLSLDLDPHASVIWADAAQMEQVVMNLVVNARDALPSGGDIRIATRPASREDAARCSAAVEPAGYVVLEVGDNGIGMDEAVKARIFEPFFSTKEFGQGTGLGLAVVYGVVRQSDGHIFVDSSPGRGTRFTILVPRGGGRSKAPAPAAPRAARERGTVLLVEDEDMIRAIVGEFLASAGYDVLEAPNGRAALERYGDRVAEIDLLLSDVVMPDLGGRALAEALRRECSDLAVVFMSGYSRDPDDRDGDGPRGGDPFLVKPFTRDQLLAVVLETLERRNARKS